MSTKRELLRLLEQHRGQRVSGQELAGLLGISRAGVWKQIAALREDGYVIEAVSGGGYCLTEQNDYLSLEGMEPYLEPGVSRENIIILDAVDSTNLEVRRRAADGAPAGTAVAADMQTAGRGRMGRKFFSPRGAGIYLSYLLRPKLTIEQSMLVTTAASVAVCRAIEQAAGIRPQIKWVNDLYLHGKKICGILTEAVTSMESGSVESMIVGIGINCTPAAFPEDLKDVAGSLFENDVAIATRNKIVAYLINQLSELENMAAERSYLEEYRERSMILGKEIWILGTDRKRGTALDIDQTGGLIVEMEDGEISTLCSGEVSIRLTNEGKRDKMKEVGKY